MQLMHYIPFLLKETKRNVWVFFFLLISLIYELSPRLIHEQIVQACFVNQINRYIENI